MQLLLSEQQGNTPTARITQNEAGGELGPGHTGLRACGAGWVLFHLNHRVSHWRAVGRKERGHGALGGIPGSQASQPGTSRAMTGKGHSGMDQSCHKRPGTHEPPAPGPGRRLMGAGQGPAGQHTGCRCGAGSRRAARPKVLGAGPGVREGAGVLVPSAFEDPATPAWGCVRVQVHAAMPAASSTDDWGAGGRAPRGSEERVRL